MDESTDEGPGRKDRPRAGAVAPEGADGLGAPDRPIDEDDPESHIIRGLD